MQCPRMHGSMDLVNLNADFLDPQTAFVCPDCHGVWMRVNECLSVLGLDCTKIAASSIPALIAIDCPHCQTPCRTADIRIGESPSSIGVNICPRCNACFFDQGIFARIFYQRLSLERASSAVLDHSPLDSLGAVCCDCGASIPSIDEMHDAWIGHCCSHCCTSPQILSESKIQNVQLVTFHGMEIKIDHWMSSTKSRIAVTPVEPCLFDVRLYSLKSAQRILRFGHRTLKLGGILRRHLDATEGIGHKTPWHVFLKQQGVAACLEELVHLGEISITFKPHSILFEIDAYRLGTEPRQRFESTIRRLLIAYERFVELSHRYSFPAEDEENEVKKPETIVPAADR